jgi:hypothetical protein
MPPTVNLLFLLLLFPIFGAAQKAEPQVSFIKEDKPYGYYVEQAELWWAKIQQDRKDAESWYHYYRACRNAQALANWKTIFLEDSPALKLGEAIVEQMAEEVPNSFYYHFVKGSTGGVSPEAGAHLVKAYEMNPDFLPVLPSMVTYATSIHDDSLRKTLNQRWWQKDDLPVSLLNYAYNTLQSVGPNGILLTQHDNDTYPAWMLQDALGIREDVWVINIDFLLYEGFRQVVFDKLGIPAFSLPEVDIDEYERNWKNVVHHLLGNYKGERPVHIGLTVDGRWYEGFREELKLNGLTLAFEADADRNLALFRDHFLLDYLLAPLQYSPMQHHIVRMNFKYIAYLSTVLKATDLPAEQQRICRLANVVLDAMPVVEKQSHYQQLFDIGGE